MYLFLLFKNLILFYFILNKRLTDCGLYKGTYHTICAPRWSSPEAIFHSKYSSRSDVWSYVCLFLFISFISFIF